MPKWFIISSLSSRGVRLRGILSSMFILIIVVILITIVSQAVKTILGRDGIPILIILLIHPPRGNTSIGLIFIIFVINITLVVSIVLLIILFKLMIFKSLIRKFRVIAPLTCLGT